MVKMVGKIASLLASGALSAGMAAAHAEDTKIVLGMSGWTGFAPLSLADKAGIFKKNGLDVDLRMIPQQSRQLALASGAIQCAATTVETHVAWNANGVPIVQIFQMDKSYGADGLAVRGDVKGFSDLKGKAIVKVVSLEPQAAAQAFVAGQNDGAMTYEPYLSTVRGNPSAGKILATTIDYPMVMDTVGCAPTWLKANPKAAQALATSYFQALEMIKAEPAKANEIMGAAVKQSGDEFARSAAYLRWADKADNQKFFANDITPFMKDSEVILLESGVIRKAPDDLAATYDTRFVQ
jgi:NitT/TauT family transport system substrate-binding protein